MLDGIFCRKIPVKRFSVSYVESSLLREWRRAFSTLTAFYAAIHGWSDYARLQRTSQVSKKLEHMHIKYGIFHLRDDRDPASLACPDKDTESGQSFYLKYNIS